MASIVSIPNHVPNPWMDSELLNAAINRNRVLDGQAISQDQNILQRGATMASTIDAQNAHNQAIQQTAIPLAQARIPYTKAQTKNLQLKNHYLPDSIIINAQNAITKAAQLKNSTSALAKIRSLNAMDRNMSPAARAIMQASNQEEINGLHQNLIQQVSGGNNNGNGGGLPLSPLLLHAAGLSDQPVNNLGQGNAPDSTINNNQQLLNKSLNDDTAKANYLFADKEQVTPYIRKAYDASTSLDEMFRDKNVRNELYDLAKYGGVKGKYNLAHDFIHDPDSYTRYLVALKSLTTNLEGKMSLQEGNPQTYESLKKVHDSLLTIQSSLQRDPKHASQYVHGLFKNIRASSKSVYLSAHPVSKLKYYDDPYKFLDKPKQLQNNAIDAGASFKQRYMSATPAEREQMKKEAGV